MIESAEETQAREAACEAIRRWAQMAWPEDTHEIITELCVVFAGTRFLNGRPSTAVGVLMGPDEVPTHRGLGLLVAAQKQIESRYACDCPDDDDDD